ncbi:MAG TPA: hypothetical protein VM324_00160 [Egibacteraceae bacterium]|nr:hypothetical protein [Egibacteraceae bacterium]
MSPRKLIFYSTTGPDADNAAWRAFTMAAGAVKHGLDCEVVLAGPATGIMRRDARSRIQGRQREAFETVQAARVPIYLSPG